MATIVHHVTDLQAAFRRRYDQVGSARVIARFLGVSPQTVINWKNGATPIVIKDGDTQERLAEFLGLSPYEVLVMSGLDVSTDRKPTANLLPDAVTIPGYRSRRPCGRIKRSFRRWRRRPDDTDLALAA